MSISTLDSKRDYSWRSMFMIDLPTIIGILIVIGLSSYLQKGFYKELTPLGQSLFPGGSALNDITEEINHLVIMFLSSGAIAMQIIFSQIIFIMLDIKKILFDSKEDKSSLKAQSNKNLDSKDKSPEN
jgi:hypothetical protein